MCAEVMTLTGAGRVTAPNAVCFAPFAFANGGLSVFARGRGANHRIFAPFGFAHGDPVPLSVLKILQGIVELSAICFAPFAFARGGPLGVCGRSWR